MTACELNTLQADANQNCVPPLLRQLTPTLIQSLKNGTMGLGHFSAVPLKAAKENFVSLFGIDAVFTGCSDMGRVQYRGNGLSAAASPSSHPFVRHHNV